MKLETLKQPGERRSVASRADTLPGVLVLEGTERIGGGQQVTLETVKSLGDAFDFHVAVPGAGELSAAFESEGVETYIVRYPAPAGSFGLLDRVAYLPRGLASLRSVISLVNRTGPSLIYATSRTALWAVIAGRITNTPVILHLHMIPPTGKTSWFLRRVGSIRPVRKVIVPSVAVAESLGLSKKRVAVIPNGVNPVRFRPRPELRSEVRAEFGIDGSSHVAAVIGELSIAKGQIRAIEAFSSLRDKHGAGAKLLIVGAERTGHEYRVELRRAAESLGVQDRVIFTGHRDDIERILSALDLLIVPSQGPSGEAAPLVVLEAWASGIPVLAADTGGIPELIGDGRGVLFTPGDSRSLAEEWTRLCASPERVASVISEGRSAAAGEFSQEASAEKLRSILLAAVGA